MPSARIAVSNAGSSGRAVRRNTARHDKPKHHGLRVGCAFCVAADHWITPVSVTRVTGWSLVT